jgi:hypothetical protein
LFDRSAWSVPAGCPEPYLYDRLFSGSEIAVGVEAASAKEEVGESAYFIKCMVAQSVRDLKIYAPNNCISLVLSPRARSSFRISLYLPEPVCEALRKIAFEEPLKIHDVVLEGIDLALRRRGYPSVEDLKAKKRP